MATPKRKDVLIEGAGEYVTGNRARRHVKAGIAQWVDDMHKAIRFCVVAAESAEEYVPAPKWKACYRTQGAPAIGPWAGGSPDWYEHCQTTPARYRTA